jgi:glyoxylase-like metal-dependent hydrolase (beta-lactamase superfamily II)
MTGLEERIFGRLPDETWIYPGHGKDSTLGAERPHLAEWRAGAGKRDTRSGERQARSRGEQNRRPNPFAFLPRKGSGLWNRLPRRQRCRARDVSTCRWS